MRPTPCLLPCLLACAGLATTHSARGQFSPYGSATISTATTAAQTLAAGTGTIASAGSISVSSTSVSLTLSGTNTTLLNYGTIANTNAGASGNPRALLADGTNIQITNELGGVIQTAGNDAVRSSSAGTSITLTNYGNITASNTTTTNPQQAIDWNSITTGANTLNNYGTIQATGNDAVRPGVNGVITNYTGGKIMSINNASGTSSDGVDAQTNTGIQVTNSGTIEGGRHGITGGLTTGTGAFTISITNNANSTLQGDNGSGVNIDGINGNEVATITNNGTITGNGSALNAGETAHDGDGVDVDGLVSLNNTGTIRSLSAINDTSEGVTVGGGTIVNSGTIEGDVANTGNTGTATGKGITVLGIDSVNPITAMYGNTTITNSGLIKGQSNSGITIGYSSTTPVTASGFTSTINNLAGGIIEGGGATAAAIQTGADNDTINNAGRIVADTSNLAIDLGGGNNTLNITGGSASIVGNVSGGMGGTNALNFNPGSGNTFSYAGSFSNFNTVQVQSGTVSLAGKSTYTGTTTVMNGGTLLANDAVGTAGSATGTGPVSIQGGGTLGGTGRVGGDVTLESGGLIAPSAGLNGGNVATLTVAGSVNVFGGSKFTFKLGPTAAQSDFLSIGVALNLSESGQIVINILDNGGLQPGSYALIGFGSASGLTAANVAFGQVPAGFTGSFDLSSGTGLSVNVNTVPEPSTWLMLAVALAIGAILARRRARA